MLQSTHQLTGLEKASVLMLSLNPDQSSKVFDKLSVEERGKLSAQIARLRHVDTITRHQVLEEVNSLMRKNTLRDIVNAERHAAHQPGVPLKWLEDLEPDHVAKLISSERPSSISLVIAHLSPQVAADVLGSLDDSLRNEVVKCLASIKTVSGEVIEAVDAALRKRYSEGDKEQDSAVPDTLLGMLSNATERAKISMLGALTRKQQASPIAKPCTSIEDLTLLSDVDLSVVISETQIEDWCVVLSVAGEELKAKVLLNMPQETRQRAASELESSSGVKLGELEAAQQRIVETAHNLEIKGRIIGVCVITEDYVE